MTVKSSENQLHALIVDDDALMRIIIKAALASIGFEVSEAKDGREGLELFDSVRPDIILLDVVMPGMNGFETCTAMRSKQNADTVPIVMVTGSDDIDSIDNAYRCGATDFINKPINTHILVQRVRYIMRASRALAEVKASEFRLANSQRMAGLGSWEWNKETKEVYCSANGLNILELAPSTERIGRGELLKYVHPSDLAMLSSALEGVDSTGKPCSLDHRLVLANGREMIVQHRIETAPSGSGGPPLLVGMVLDITETKKAEWLEKDRNQVMEMIVANDSLRKILALIARTIERQCPQGHCCINILRDRQLSVISAPSLDDSFVELLDASDVSESCGSCSMAARQASPVAVMDISTSPIWENRREAALAQGYTASLSVPITSGKGNVLGTVGLLYQDDAQPSMKDQELLEKLGRLCAIGMEQRELNEQLLFYAQHDALTKLPNRASFMSRLEFAITHALRYKKKIALIYIDLDRFKQVNDSLGHHVGDQVLKEVAKRLRSSSRKSDSLARMGGDEFMLFLYPVTDRQEAALAADRLLKLLNEPFHVDGRELLLVASIGISLFPDDAADSRSLQQNSDIAMYHAKNDGGNRCNFFTKEMNEAVIDRLQVENDLRKALERDEFELYYQPQFELPEEKLIGFEALLRWTHPQWGKIPPDKFIPVAEESALIIPIGRWVLHEACRQCVEWQQMGLGDYKIAVNISGVHFTQNDFVAEVTEILERTGMNPALLELEVTETTILKNIKVISSNLSELKKLGITTAIDDFGTGYSSMSYLQQLPVDCLKIDRSFVRRIADLKDDGERSKALIRSFVMLARSLGLGLVAEGVENLAQQNFLVENGCNLAQGFLLSVPLTKAESEVLMRSRYPQLLAATGSCRDLADTAP